MYKAQQDFQFVPALKNQLKTTTTLFIVNDIATYFYDV